MAVVKYTTGRKTTTTPRTATGSKTATRGMPHATAVEPRRRGPVTSRRTVPKITR